MGRPKLSARGRRGRRWRSGGEDSGGEESGGEERGETRERLREGIELGRGTNPNPKSLTKEKSRTVECGPRAAAVAVDGEAELIHTEEERAEAVVRRRGLGRRRIGRRGEGTREET